MKKYLLMIMVCVVFLLSVALAGCDNGGTDNKSATDDYVGNAESGYSDVTRLDNADNLPVTLAMPANLDINVTGRLMTVTWESVPSASGYIIYTTSTGCASGNKIVNTATKTAKNHAGEEVNSAVAEHGITTNGNGFVTFTSETSFTILLMAEGSDSQHENIPMSTALTAKIMAVSGDDNYSDSDYSEIVSLEKVDYLPATQQDNLN